MGRLYKISFALLLLILFAQVLIFAPEPLEEKESKADFYQQDLTPENERMIGEQVAEGVHLVETREEKRDWELFAKKAQGNKGQDLWEMTDVRVIFHSSPTVTFTVTGNQGRFQLDSKNMEIEGDVVVISSNGYRFRTERVKYNAQDRILTSPKKVDIRGPQDVDGHRLIIFGGSMVANMNNSTVQIAEYTQASKKLSEDRTLLVKSRQANLSGKSYTAEFIGNVRLSLNDLVAKGPRAVFQIDTGTKKILSANMLGGVSLETLDAMASSKELNVDFAKDRIKLTGHPRLKQGEDEIAGDVILFSEGGEQVRVLDARARVKEEKARGEL